MLERQRARARRPCAGRPAAASAVSASVRNGRRGAAGQRRRRSCRQAFGGVLAHRLQHLVARPAVRLVDRPQQAGGDQRCRARRPTPEPGVVGRGAHGLGRLQVEAAGEDAQPREQALLGRRRAGRSSRPASPAASAGGPAARQRRPSAAAALRKSGEQRRGREQVGARGGQLDRQRQAVQPRADARRSAGASSASARSRCRPPAPARRTARSPGRRPARPAAAGAPAAGRPAAAPRTACSPPSRAASPAGDEHLQLRAAASSSASRARRRRAPARSCRAPAAPARRAESALQARRAASWPGCSRTPSASAIAVDEQTPGRAAPPAARSRRRRRSRRAAPRPPGSASRVLPTPPGPVSVTSRTDGCRSRSPSRASSPTRPISGVAAAGRPWPRTSRLTSGGNSAGRSAATTW